MTDQNQPEVTSPWPRRIELASFAAFLISILLGMLLPIYTDEVGWRMQLRAGIDGGVDRMISDICGPHTIIAPPWFMMPFRWASAWLNLTFADPLYVRIAGVASALGFAFMLRALIGQIAAEERQRTALRTLAFALLGMGILPLMLVMNRPDQVILLAMTGALLLAFKAAKHTRIVWLPPFAIVLLGTLAVSYHLKGILIAPLILVCIWFAGAGKAGLKPRLLAMLLFVGIAAQGANYWVVRFRCTDDPILATMLANQNIASVVATGRNWQEVTLSAITGADPNNYLIIAEARKFPMSDWLPREKISGEASAIRYQAMRIGWNGALLIAVICLILALRQRLRERRIDLATAAPVTLAGMGMAWGISQFTRNDYEIMIALPMMALFCVIAITAVGWTPRRTRQLGVAASIIAALSILAQADIMQRYGPPLLAVSRQPGHITTQPYSVSAYGYSGIRQKILSTAKLCHIGSQGRAQRPLVDDVTYFAFMDSWRPFHQLGVIGKWNGSIKNPVAYLKANGSEGAIMDCRKVPFELGAKAIRNGDFCCIPAR